MSFPCDVSAFIRMAGLRQRTIPESHNRRTRIDKILNKRSQDEIVISRSTVQVQVQSSLLSNLKAMVRADLI